MFYTFSAENRDKFVHLGRLFLPNHSLPSHPVVNNLVSNEPNCAKTGILPMQKQRRRSALQ